MSTLLLGLAGDWRGFGPAAGWRSDRRQAATRKPQSEKTAKLQLRVGPLLGTIQPTVNPGGWDFSLFPAGWQRMTWAASSPGIE